MGRATSPEAVFAERRGEMPYQIYFEVRCVALQSRSEPLLSVLSMRHCEFLTRNHANSLGRYFFSLHIYILLLYTYVYVYILREHDTALVCTLTYTSKYIEHSRHIRRVSGQKVEFCRTMERKGTRMCVLCGSSALLVLLVLLCLRGTF